MSSPVCYGGLKTFRKRMAHHSAPLNFRHIRIFFFSVSSVFDLCGRVIREGCLRRDAEFGLNFKGRSTSYIVSIR